MRRTNRLLPASNGLLVAVRCPVIAAGVVGALTACAGARVVPSVSEPERPAVVVRIDRAVERAVSAAEDVDVVNTRLRVNPADCDCPRWEAYLFGQWVRVAIDGAVEPSTIASEPSMSVEPVAAGTIVEATVAITSRSVVSETGWPYRLIRIVHADTP